LENLGIDEDFNKAYEVTVDNSKNLYTGIAGLLYFAIVFQKVISIHI
jgi:hypothetical protein